MAAECLELQTEQEMQAALLQMTVKQLYAEHMTEGVPVPTDWFHSFRSFVDGTSNVNPGPIPNYPVSNDRAIDARVLPQDLYDKVEAVLGSTGCVCYTVKKTADTWVLVDERNTTKFLYARINNWNRNELDLQIQGRTYKDKKFCVFLAVSWTTREMMDEIYAMDGDAPKDDAPKVFPITVEYYPQPQIGSYWNVMPDDQTMGELLELARIQPKEGSKFIVLKLSHA